jgi:DNA-directed RNA polymerase alpha subunit
VADGNSLNLEDLQLDRRTVQALKRSGVFTLCDLNSISDHDLSMIAGIGKTSLTALRLVREN